ncbi:hypothetical protein GQ55_2G212200 [Panicum hallii var. hallii]|uniref:Uncharacterized protein n=1 Tax=Panicum hallii var. hallii TaxID=1504633 RepID=A0A2T7ER16_9POAL|nr:hypothetical protein GQ55_2G212200 [Panicum hallii var. hallii]
MTMLSFAIYRSENCSFNLFSDRHNLTIFSSISFHSTSNNNIIYISLPQHQCHYHS